MSEVILNLVPRKKGGSKNFCSTRDQVAKLFSAIVGTRLGRVPKMQWYGTIPFYPFSRRCIFLAMAAIVTLTENR
jgi:hypothetical protein